MDHPVDCSKCKKLGDSCNHTAPSECPDFEFDPSYNPNDPQVDLWPLRTKDDNNEQGLCLPGLKTETQDDAPYQWPDGLTPAHPEWWK